MPLVHCFEKHVVADLQTETRDSLPWHGHGDPNRHDDAAVDHIQQVLIGACEDMRMQIGQNGAQEVPCGPCGMSACLSPNA